MNMNYMNYNTAIYNQLMNMPISIDKATLADGSTNMFGCKDGKNFLDNNTVGTFVRDSGAGVDYTNCSLGNQNDFERKFVDGSHSELATISGSGSVDFNAFNKQMAGFTQNVNDLTATNDKRILSGDLRLVILI